MTPSDCCKVKLGTCPVPFCISNYLIQRYSTFFLSRPDEQWARSAVCGPDLVDGPDPVPGVNALGPIWLPGGGLGVACPCGRRGMTQPHGSGGERGMTWFQPTAGFGYLAVGEWGHINCRCPHPNAKFPYPWGAPKARYHGSVACIWPVGWRLSIPDLIQNHRSTS